MEAQWRCCLTGKFPSALYFVCRIVYTESAAGFHFDNLDFNSMKLGHTLARRLSTASSVTKPPHFILTTEWAWYWMDEFGSWQEYGRQVCVVRRDAALHEMKEPFQKKAQRKQLGRHQNLQITWKTLSLYKPIFKQLDIFVH